MGIMLSKNLNDKNDLQSRIDADLRARVQKSATDDDNQVDFTPSTEGARETGRFAWVWLVLIILAILSLIIIAMI